MKLKNFVVLILLGIMSSCSTISFDTDTNPLQINLDNPLPFGLYEINLYDEDGGKVSQGYRFCWGDEVNLEVPRYDIYMIELKGKSSEEKRTLFNNFFNIKPCR